MAKRKKFVDKLGAALDRAEHRYYRVKDAISNLQATKHLCRGLGLDTRIFSHMIRDLNARLPELRKAKDQAERAWYKSSRPQVVLR